MTATVSGDAQSPTADGARLRVAICDELAKQRHGVTTVEGQALLFGLHRGQIFRMRRGHRTASLPTAMRMAAILGTTVEVLFERVADR